MDENTAIVAEKKRLRREMRRRRASLALDERTQASQRVCQHILSCALWQKATHIALYMAFDHELSVHSLIANAYHQKKTVLLPAITGKDTMRFFPVTPQSMLRKNAMGILEPYGSPSLGPMDATQPIFPQLFIVPGLAFDSYGYRLGYGGGYYDRFLAHTHSPTIGVAFAIQYVPHLPTTFFDQKMTMVVTEEHCLCF